MKTDYTEELLALLRNNYEPVNSVMEEDEYTEKKKLDWIHSEVTNILPATWITEGDVYEALQELGFKSFMYTFPEVVDKKGKVLRPETHQLLYLMNRRTAAV